MKHLNTFKIFESIDKSILSDIDVIDSFFDDLSDDGFQTHITIRFYEVGKPGESTLVNDTVSALDYFSKNGVVGTINYHIGISKSKGTVDDYALLKKHIESFRGRILDFTYCRIDNLSIDCGYKHREIFSNKNEVYHIHTYNHTSANINVSNVQSKRHIKHETP
jgi:hypothetical protein